MDMPSIRIPRKNFFQRNKSAIIYGFSLAVLLFVLRWAELRFMIIAHSFEIYAGLIAILFTALGIWLALKLSRPRVKTVVVEKEVFVAGNGAFIRDEALVARLDLSRRELEILGLMARGHSNREIAEQLFVSLSTVKSHNQNLFLKLDVKRRIQAVEKARRLSLVP